MARHQRDHEREQTWRQHLQRQVASGRSVRDYCREHGLTESLFYYWRRAIAERDRQAAASVPTPAFVPVVLADSPAPVAASPIDIRLAGGQRLRVRSGCDRELLAAVVALLEDRPC